MPVVSVVIDDATLRSLDDIARDLRRETGENVTRSDVLKEAIHEFIQNTPGYKSQE